MSENEHKFHVLIFQYIYVQIYKVLQGITVLCFLVLASGHSCAERSRIRVIESNSRDRFHQEQRVDRFVESEYTL